MLEKIRILKKLFFHKSSELIMCVGCEKQNFLYIIIAEKNEFKMEFTHFLVVTDY